MLDPEDAGNVIRSGYVVCPSCPAQWCRVFATKAGLNTHAARSHYTERVIDYNKFIDVICLDGSVVSANCMACGKVFGSRQKAYVHLAQRAPECRRRVQDAEVLPMNDNDFKEQRVARTALLKMPKHSWGGG